MEEFLDEEKELTVERCKNLGLKEFDTKEYIELDILGKGSYGIVKKYKFIPKHELHAVKTVKIKNIPEEKVKKYIISFLVER